MIAARDVARRTFGGNEIERRYSFRGYGGPRRALAPRLMNEKNYNDLARRIGDRSRARRCVDTGDSYRGSRSFNGRTDGLLTG